MMFFCCLINLSTTVRKLHHHVSLNAKATADIRWWDSFLPSWNGVTMFLDPEWTAADSLQLFTDASGSLGFGTYYNGAWFRGDWQPQQRLPLHSIQWQELMAAASTWGHLMHPLPLQQLPQCPGLGKTVCKTSRPHPNPVSSGNTASPSACHIYLHIAD